MALPTISLTESQVFTALRSFLLTATLPATDVIKAQTNRVPEPINPDFILMTPLRQERLETNETTFQDNIFTGSIAVTTLTVTSIQRAVGPLAPGLVLRDTTTNLATNTVIVAQLTGPTGGVGTYTIVPAQTVNSETMYAGLRADVVATKLTVQLDVHGPNSDNNTRIIDTLFRSEFGTDSFVDSGFEVVPLYCDEAKQMSFVNDQQQYEDRWSMDACLQISPIIGTNQQFADQLEVTLVEVDQLT